HGYGATTFGRLVAAIRGLPVILHEHANLTDTPWFQKVADRLLEPATDIALAVSTRTAEEIAAARLELGIAPDDFAIGTVTRLHDSKGNSYLIDAAAAVVAQRPDARFYLVGEGPLLASLQQQ